MANVENIVTIVGANTTRSEAATVDAEMIPELLIRLTDAYQKPIDSIVRETISNAIDTTKRAGSNIPVEITTPSRYIPKFIVKDYGEGMTEDELFKNFKNYGNSTKKLDGKQIGSFGIGAKAPLAYARSFHVESIKDGQYLHAVMTRQDTSTTMDLLEKKATDEPNGTTITVPVDLYDIPAFSSAIESHRYYALLNDYMIDGKFVSGNDNFLLFSKIPVMVNPDTGETKYGKVWIQKNYILGLLSNPTAEIDYLVSGYLYNSKVDNAWEEKNARLVVEVPSKVVDFPSPREQILRNDKYDRMESLVNDYLTSNKIYEDFYTFLQNSQEDALPLLVRLNPEIVTIDDKMKLNFTFDLVKRAVKLVDFDRFEKDGKNFVKDLLKFHKKKFVDFIGFERTNETYFLDPKKGDDKKYLFQNFDSNKHAFVSVTKAYEKISENIDTKDAKYSILDVLMARSWVSNASYAKNVIFVSGATPKKFTSVMRSRKNLLNNTGINYFVPLASSESISPADKKLIKALAENFDLKVDYASVDDLLNKIVEARAAYRAEKKKETVYFYGVKVTLENLNQLDIVDSSVHCASEKFSEEDLKEYVLNGDIFLISENSQKAFYRDLLFALYKNFGEEKILGRNIHFLVNPNKSFFDAMGDYDSVFALDTYVHRSKAVNNFLKEHLLHGKYSPSDSISLMSDDEVLFHYKNAISFYYTFAERSFMDGVFKNEHFKVIGSKFQNVSNHLNNIQDDSQFHKYKGIISDSYILQRFKDTDWVVDLVTLIRFQKILNSSKSLYPMLNTYKSPVPDYVKVVLAEAIEENYQENRDALMEIIDE